MMKTREDLTEVSRGYWQSRAVLSGVELGIFEAMGRRKLSAKSLAIRIAGDPGATELLLNALTGMGVLEKEHTSYRIAPAMLPLLTEGEGSALAMLKHHARLWDSWSRLSEAVKKGGPVRDEAGFRGGPEEARAFTMAMRAGARRLAPVVAAELAFRGRRHLLDLGGGPGVYAAAFARANPKLRVTIVDLPAVADVGTELLAEYPDVRSRLAYHAADIDREALPEGADCAFLSHVIHSQSEAEIEALFAKVAGALRPPGVFIVRDFFTSADRTMPPSSSLFALNMLVNTPAGRTYSFDEVAGWLKKAGFTRVAKRKSKGIPDTGYVIGRL